MNSSALARIAIIASISTGLVLLREIPGSAQNYAPRFVGPLSSQPLALTADDKFLVVANPDNNSVSFFDVREDRNRRLAQVPVQNEPNGVVFAPDGRTAYVANTVSGTVTVIHLNLANGVIQAPTEHIKVGTEPYSLLLTPNGSKLYVANSRSNDVTVIDTASLYVDKTITGVGVEPRGLAMTNDGDENDDDETLYATNFLSLPVPGKLDGADDSKQGIVAVIPTSSNTVTKLVTLNPLADTGFRALGDALGRIAPLADTDPANFKFPTGAYPNQLNNIAIKGNYAFIPNTGASPNGPVRFNVNTQSLLSSINLGFNEDTGRTINMHKAVDEQTNPTKLFITQPWAMAFKHAGLDAYVVSAASNIVVKVATDPSTGAATVQSDPADPTRVLQIRSGKNPRGIVINSTDERAYVMNYVSRDVTVISLPGTESVVGTMQSADLPTPGTQEDKIHVGKELYNTSVGVFDPPTPFSAPIVGRMSNKGWGACSACHPNALSDNVVWIFPAGPRRTIPQHADFDLGDPDRKGMRLLNWSANRDEQEDFEGNIRAVSGGQGLIVLEDGVTQDLNVNDFTPLANGSRNQLKVRGANAWDGLKAYIQFAVRAPISPVSKTDPDAVAGGALFRAANCQQCHGGAQWTTSRVRFNPPPDGSQVVAGQLIAELRNVGTFDATLFNEVRQNLAAPPLGAAGFVPPSLLSIHAFPQTFFHNGVAGTLDAVLDNVTHRSSGTAGTDILSNSSDRAKLVKFLLSIDAATPPIAP